MRVRTLLAVGRLHLDVAHAVVSGGDQVDIREVALRRVRIDREPAFRGQLATHIDLADQRDVGDGGEASRRHVTFIVAKAGVSAW